MWRTTAAIILLVASAAAARLASIAYTGHVAAAPSTASVCPTPPADFDILAASNADLQYYGLPHPPAGSLQLREAWARHIAPTLNHHVCPPEVASSKYHEILPQPNVAKSGQFGTTDYGVGNIWAGYEATDGGFDWTFSDWQVPCYVGSKSPSKSAAVQWVGMGGVGSNLWQAGTETDPGEGYRFWYEYVPGSPITYFGPSVGCGDHVAVQVDYNVTKSNQSYVWMGNYTRGQYASTQKSFVPGSNTAEWIDERPSCNFWPWNPPGPDQLADFNYTNWSYSQAESTYYGNSIEPISFYSNTNLTMTDNGQWSGSLLAAPTGLGSDGKSFTDWWYNNGTKQNDC